MLLQEKVKTVWKTLTYEDVRIVCSTEVTRRSRRCGSAAGATPPAAHSPSSSAGNRDPSCSNHCHRERERGAAQASSFLRRVGTRVRSRESLLGIFRARAGEGDRVAPHGSPVTPPPSLEAANHRQPAECPERSPGTSEEEQEEPEDVEMVIRMHIPTDITPSHSIHPIMVSHRGELILLAISLMSFLTPPLLF